jgi:hypothetical protein
MPELPRESLAMEYYEDDVNKMSDIARSDSGLSTIHDATGGDPSGSPRWKANMAMGGDQELIATLRTRAGGVWGAVTLYREPDQPLFDAAEKRFMQQAASQLAEGVRRALLFGEATDLGVRTLDLLYDAMEAVRRAVRRCQSGSTRQPDTTLTNGSKIFAPTSAWRSLRQRDPTPSRFPLLKHVIGCGR